MVRFKRGRGVNSQILAHRSQFHYGSIQTYNAILQKENGIKSHNSTMVRFKPVGDYEIIKLNEGESQFHYGSIQTKMKTIIFMLKDRVTIPLWFDSNRDVDARIAKIRESQFHYGSIQTRYNEETKQIEKGHNSTMVRFKQG